MKVIKSAHEMREISRKICISGDSISFVPTMGYLHQGHINLIHKAKEIAKKVIVSIFVNPTQFAPNEDFSRYPRDFETDLKLCIQEKVDFVFAPDTSEIYSDNHQTFIVNEELSSLLCGQSRPTHFRGVLTIVTKLLNIIDPDFAIFGQKDGQQAIIIRKMVNDLNFGTKIIIEPTTRETDGLAMSSRNKYLSKTQRENANNIYKNLLHAKKQIQDSFTNFEEINQNIISTINEINDFKVDYLELVNADTLKSEFKKGDDLMLAIAVFAGTTRLIDNIVFKY